MFDPVVLLNASPLHAGGEATLSDENFGEQLWEFVASFNDPRVHFDGAIDKGQLALALTSFGKWRGQVPGWKPVLVTRAAVLGELEIYFSSMPKMAMRRHHAAMDAEALRTAYRKIVGC